ncbi:MAG: hypothetical protein PUD20_09155 [bacterium]|nr:hypothetical protein [bacterium]
MARREHSKDEILFKDMTTEQKLSYLKDYWSIPVVIVIVVILAIGWVIHTARTNVKPIFSVTTVDAAGDERIRELVDAFAQENEIDLERISVGDIAVGKSSQGAGPYSTQGMALYVRLQAQNEDIVILPEETFYEYAEYGYFIDLTAVVPEKYSDKLIVVKQAEDETENTGVEQLACGIRTSDIPALADDGYYGQAVIAISYLPKNMDMAKQFLNYVLE